MNKEKQIFDIGTPTQENLTRNMAKWKPTISFGLDDTKSVVGSNNFVDVKQGNVIYNKETEADKIIDYNGNDIINYSNEKEWFYKNIVFVFSIGKIFDEEDDKLTNEILACFSTKPNAAYLINNYYVKNFDDELVKAIEEKYNVGNGNYHLMLSVVCVASDDDIKNAPMNELKHRGIINCLTSFNTINSAMKKYISLFGFVAEYVEQFHDGRVRHNMYNVDKGSTFDITKPIDKITVLSDAERLKKIHIFKNLPLYAEIHDKDVILKSTEKYIPVDNRKAEFILFDGKDTYDKENGINVLENVNPASRGNIPNVFSNAKNNNNTKRFISNELLIFPK